MPAPHDPRIARKRRREIWFGRNFLNPLVKAVNKTGLLPKSTVELETIGRKTGRARVVPVTVKLDPDGKGAWFFSQHGTQSGWGANLTANPRVRMKVRGAWRPGTARLVPEDDVVARRKTFPKIEQLAIKALETTPISVRVDFD